MTTSLPARQTTGHLLSELLANPLLDRQLARLDTTAWIDLVAAAGLEDSGELLALATPEQLLPLLDEEIWSTQGGGHETVDAERFASFLEAVAASGVVNLAQKLAGLSEDFLRLAFGQLISVWARDLLAGWAGEEQGDQVEKALENHQAEDIGEYVVVSRSGFGWDVMMEILAQWNETEPELLDRILSGLAAASEAELSDSDGLVEVLEGMERVREEAEAEREERRAKRGYVSVSDARAFLRLPIIEMPTERDAISKAYFRRLRRESTVSAPRMNSAALRQLLKRARNAPKELGEPERLLRRALRLVAERSPEEHQVCVDELAFLVNVVVAHLTASGMPTNSIEALRLVAAHIEFNVILADRPMDDEETEMCVEHLSQTLVLWKPIGLFRHHRFETPPRTTSRQSGQRRG